MSLLFLTSLLSLNLAQAGGPIPSYESINAIVGAGPKLPTGCERYDGELSEVWRLPIVGKGEARFSFEGKLTAEGWTEVQWTEIDHDYRRGFLEDDDQAYNDGEPALGPIHGGGQDNDEGGEEGAEVGERPDDDEHSVSVSFKFGGKNQRGDASAAPVAPSAPTPTATPAPEPSSKEEGGLELSWSQRVAARVALGRVMAEQEEALREVGIDPDALEASLRESLKTSKELDIEAMMSTAIADQISARPELALLGVDVESLSQSLESGDIDIEEIAAKLEALEDSGELATGALVAQGLSEEEADAALKESGGLVEAGGLYYKSAADIPERAIKEGQVQEDLPQPEAEGIYGEIQEILKLVDTEVELRHVVTIRESGREYYELQRIADTTSTFFGGERRTGSFVVVDAQSLLPLSYRVVVEHPIRLKKKTGAPGKIKSLTYKLDQDLRGHVTGERIEVSYNLGPIIVRLDRQIDWTYKGLCEVVAPALTEPPLMVAPESTVPVMSAPESKAPITPAPVTESQ